MHGTQSHNHIIWCRPDSAEPGASLAISGGMGGARLTHSHERQFHYVLQSLTLWREISHEVLHCLRSLLAARQARGGVLVLHVRHRLAASFP